MKQKTKRILSILVILSIFLVIGLTLFCAFTGNGAFYGMLALMFFYPLLLWVLIFLYKKNKEGAFHPRNAPSVFKILRLALFSEYSVPPRSSHKF